MDHQKDNWCNVRSAIRRRPRGLAWVDISALILVAAVGLASGIVTRPALAAPTYKAEIRWTPYGVPHIKADDYGSLGFGAGMASAELTICELYDRILTVSAKRAFYLGRGTNNSNVNSDLFYARHRLRVQAWLNGDPASVDTPSATARALVSGYVAGINNYVRQVGAANIPDPRCRGAAWIKEIDELDYWSFLSSYYGFTNQSGIIAAIPPGGTSDCPVMTASASRVASGANDLASPALDDVVRPDPSTIGSNAYGLGGQVTKNGRGGLLGNPHYPWSGSNRFYRLHLTIPGELNVDGAGLINMPAVGIGHTDKIAWSHTVSTATRFGYFELTLDPSDPTAYMFEGQSRKMSVVCVSVPVLESDGSITTASRAFYETQFGPMVNTATFPWTPTRGFALRDATLGVRFVDQYLALYKAANVSELADALNMYGATTFNTIAADPEGNAFYGDIGAIPHVTEAQAAACTISPTGTAQWANRVPVLDGSRADCQWGSDPGAVPGLFGRASSPNLITNDYVENSNDSYWLPNATQRLTGYSRVFGTEGTVRSLRTRMGLKMIEERKAGTDGLPGTNFDLEAIEDVMYSDRGYSAEMSRQDLVARCQAQTSVVVGGQTVDLTQACAVLAAWDLRDSLDSRGAHIWRQFVATNGLVLTVPFDVNDPLNTPNTLSPTSSAVMTALGQAVLTMNNNHIPLDARLGDIQGVTPQGERIPLHGGSGSDGTFNVLTTGGLQPNVGWTTVLTGSSWIMAVYFTDDGPRSQGVLTYSQSTNPDSPYYADQTRLFSQYGWEDLYFTEAAVEAATVRTDTLLGGCGDEVVDGEAGEACDLGAQNGMPGSCCDASCEFVTAGTTCTDDGDICTDDYCNGAGGCIHPYNTSPCDDGDACTLGDTCHDGACIGTNFCPTDKEQCKEDGWRSLITATGEPFKNQGDCVSYVNTGK